MKIATLRFSSMGDVAISVPVIYKLLENNKNLQIDFYTKKPFSDLFIHKNERLKVLEVDFKNKYSGFLGLLKLFFYIKKQRYDFVIDIHNVLRTWVLGLFALLFNIKLFVVDKQRSKKKAILNKKKEKVDRVYKTYLNTFKKTGIDISFSWEIRKIKKQNKYVVGVSPFASNKGKTLPLKILYSLLEEVSKKTNIEYVFYGSKNEKIIINSFLENKKINYYISKSKSIKEEILEMRNLDFMISMDSANMHLSSIAKTPVFSIWCSTKPNLGFLGIGQSKDMIIENDKLSCSPCSVFGTNKCINKNKFECYNISVKNSVKKILYCNDDLC